MQTAEPAKIQAAFDMSRSASRDGSGFLLLLGGVVLPIAAIGTELLFHLCGQVFFNPLPSFLHVLLAALIPIANLWILLSPAMVPSRRLRWMVWMNGAAIGVAAFYSVIFIPLLPIGAIALIYLGMGLLILAPPLALAASVGFRRRLSRLAGVAGEPRPKPRGLWAGFFCAFGLLLLIEMRSTVTRLGVSWTASNDAATQVRGVRLLRAIGDEDLMLKLCYAWPTRATDLTEFLLSLGKPVGTDQARTTFYQVVGETFTSRPAPDHEDLDWFGSGRFDGEQGGNAVAGKVPGLALSASRIDASIDAQAALGYQEWTLEFANEGSDAAEARAQIELPPDGVVSRLTLWVNGEEREAAFASRGQVRAAYERVVRTRRDPVLVTTLGKDRVLMQCFPVPAQGGRMKVRLGITAPLAFTASGEAHFHVPRFAERNFETGDPMRGIHTLWLEATEPFQSPGADWTLGNEGDTHVLRGARSDAWLSAGRSFAVSGGGGTHAAWTVDSVGAGKSVIRQWTESAVRAPLGTVTLVVDGSKGMRPYLERVCGAIRRSGRPMRVVLAGSDEIREFKGSAQEAGNWLERQPCVGGQDNVVALQKGWEAATRDRDGVVLWISAAQPALLTQAWDLRQSLERMSTGPRILALQVENGPNRLLEALHGLPITLLRFSGSLQEELESLLASTAVTHTVLVRRRSEPEAGDAVERPTGTAVGTAAGTALGGDGKRTSDHLVRLYANAEILRLLAEGTAQAKEQALAMASAYRLVTPVSGAVVLETDAQYAAAGLEPGGTATVPGVPEPETVLLAVVAALVLLARIKPWRYLESRQTLKSRKSLKSLEAQRCAS